MKPEAILIRQIKDYCGYQNIYAKRINAGIIKTAKENTFYRSVEAGTADFILCLCGRFVACEAKSARGKQSPKQKIEQQKVEEAGGVYWLVHSIEEFIEKVRVFKKTVTT